MSTKAVQQQLIACLPNLRAFAVSLCRDAEQADDLVQEAILRAWKHLDAFEEGTNLRAWVFTILRNYFYTQLRKRREEVSLEGDDGIGMTLCKPPEQHGWMESRDFLRAVGHLPPEQCEALILVGAEGFTYDETAEICGCPVGTIKSRVNRARNRLLELLDPDALRLPAEVSTRKALVAQPSLDDL